METVSQIIESVVAEMCDKRCKMPGIHKMVNEEHNPLYLQMYTDLIDIELSDSDYCTNCPLNKLL